MKVDFFIVGAPKAGTTSLHYYLNEHPEILMSSLKVFINISLGRSSIVVDCILYVLYVFY